MQSALGWKLKWTKFSKRNPQKQNQRGTRTILKKYFTAIYNSKDT